MEVTYTIAGFILLVVVLFFHSRNVFAFARRGEDYLQTLIDAPEKFDNDPDIIRQLTTKDFPRLVEFISIEPRMKSIMLVALIVNIVGIFYPVDALVGSYVGWFLLLLLTIVNTDAMMTFLALRRNKQIVSKLCNGYYNLVQAHEFEREKFLNMADAINAAFAEIEEEIKTKINEVDADGEDEQR